MKSVFGGVSNSINVAPTIDEVGGENCPSLKAYWKFSDGDYVNGIIPDHSGNGFDLVATSTHDDEPIGSRVFSEGDGYLVGDGFMVTGYAWAFATEDLTGTDLMPDDRFMVNAISSYKNIFNCDNDRGSAWMPNGGGHPHPTDEGTFTGWNWGEIGDVNLLRFVVDGVTQGTTSTYTGFGSGIDQSVSHCAMSFNPGVETFGAQYVLDSNGDVFTPLNTKSETTTVPATMGVQNNRIGFRNSIASGTNVTRGTKDVQIWYFDSEPVYMKETVQWLALNPGKIPPWWIGR